MNFGKSLYNLGVTAKELASTPATPASGTQSIYPKTDGKWYTLDDAGTETEIGSGSGNTVQGDITQEINAQTGTTYTLVDADHGKLVTLSNASAITLTVPTGLRADFECAVMQLGAGAATFTASGTTINNRQSFTVTAGQYALAGIRQYTTSTFVTTGDMA